MGAGHEHHAGARHRWRLAVAFGLVAGLLRRRAASRPASGSLALLSDAGHMAADVVALGAALVATTHRHPPRHDGPAHLRLLPGRGVRLRARRAAHARGLGLRRRRGGRPHRRRPSRSPRGPMLVVGASGLVVNLVALVLLRGGAAESLNVKGAYLEVVADTVGSVGVIVAGAARQPHRRRPCGTPSSRWPSASSSRSAPWRSGARCLPCSASTPCRHGARRP